MLDDNLPAYHTSVFERRAQLERVIRATKEHLKECERERDNLDEAVLQHFIEEGQTSANTVFGYTIYTRNSSYVGKKDYCDETKIALDHPDLVAKKIDLKQVQEILEQEGESELKTELEKYYYLSSSTKIALRKV